MHRRLLFIIIAILVSLILFNKYYIIDGLDKDNTYNNQLNYEDNNYISTDSEINIVKKNKKTVYLTFDDGPTNNMYKILDILDDYDAKASFFFVASKLSTYRQQSRIARAKSHAIGSHSFSHIPNEVYSSIDSFKEDLALWQVAFNKELGFIPTLYRFPYGSNSKFIYVKNEKDCLSRLATKVLKNMNIIHVDWNVSSGDGVKQTTADLIYDNVTKGMDEKDVPVVLLHEWNENTLSVLEKILEYGKQKGYTFEALNKDMKMPQFVE